jgi:ribose transport system permease protein
MSLFRSADTGEEAAAAREGKPNTRLASVLGWRPLPVEGASGSGLFARSALLIFFLAVIGLFSGLEPHTFPTSATVITIVTSQTAPLMLALPLMITFRLSDLDISFAAVMILSSAVGAILITAHHVPLAAAIPIILAIGLVAGLVNGCLVVLLKLPALIATLGTLSLCEGAALGITNQQVVSLSPKSPLVQVLSNGPGGIPVGSLIAWGIFLVVWLTFEFTPFGRYLLFVGGNRRAAELLGLPVTYLRMLAYTVSALLYAAAGIVLMGMIGTVDPTSDTSYLLPPLAAVFLGTTVFQVGRFNAWGTILAIYTLAVITTGLELFGLNAWVGDLFNGLALIAAILLARFLTRGSSAAELRL